MLPANVWEFNAKNLDFLSDNLNEIFTQKMSHKSQKTEQDYSWFSPGITEKHFGMNSIRKKWQA